MNWNDNVKTQGGNKVKLADFIKSTAGFADVRIGRKLMRYVKPEGSSAQSVDFILIENYEAVTENHSQSVFFNVAGQSDGSDTYGVGLYSAYLNNDILEVTSDKIAGFMDGDLSSAELTIDNTNLVLRISSDTVIDELLLDVLYIY